MSEEAFQQLTLSARDRGILKTVGEREVVVNVRVLADADSADNEWLMEEVKNVYMRYYSRVCDYTKQR
ncbi:MAG: hypothetical protein J6B06_07175 [Lachnospiraceae bacterium]|nr:hypothetical protein [Lachnospiraceae bacterium]